MIKGKKKKIISAMLTRAADKCLSLPESKELSVPASLRRNSFIVTFRGQKLPRRLIT